MSTMGASQGPLTPPTDIMESTDHSAEHLTSAMSQPCVDENLALPKDAAAVARSVPLDCDSIFGESETSAHANQPVTYVTQSKFFTPLFNAAIFDGPIRIYFAQHQESQAMKLYFNLQERYGDLRQQARAVFRERGSNIFVMLYPDAVTFENAFGVDFDDVRGDSVSLGQGVGAEAGAKPTPSACTKTAVGAAPVQTIASDRMGGDHVLGVRGPIADETFEALCQKMENIVRHAD